MLRTFAAKRQHCHLQRRTNTERLFEHLHRGGHYAQLWTDAGHQSFWFGVNNGPRRTVRTIPRPWLSHNVYFAVHPLAQIPPQNSSGNTDRRFISSQLAYITAVNTLFAEYDGKDYVEPMEYDAQLPPEYAQLKFAEQRNASQIAKEMVFYTDPARFKQRAWAVIEALYFPPSVIVDSGGGYHCYWLLRDSVPVDDANRADLQAVQHGWVQMVQADPGAADLRRMLRVPGSYNMKAGFGAQHPRVNFCKADFTLLYPYNLLDETVNDWLFAQRPQRMTSARRWRKPRGHSADVRALFNQHHSIVDLLTQHGYQVSYKTNALTRLARPGRAKNQSSVTVFAARDDGTPELAVHFSSNDALYSEFTIDPESGQSKRQIRDAYGTYLILEQAGN